MRSMTGFGRGICEAENRKVVVEIKTVNHKQLDLSIKAPRAFASSEDAVRKVCKKNIFRGHADVYLTYVDNREDKTVVKIDDSVVKAYKDAAASLEKIGIKNDLTASSVMRLPDVITVENTEDDEKVLALLAEKATSEACKNHVKMSKKEGAALKKELVFRLNNLQGIVSDIEERAPLVAENYAERLKAKLSEALQNVAVDESKFLTEVACFVDKSNIDEEITRLKTHLKHGFDLMEEENEVGKKLDFLVQEINREINTTGSKSNDIVLTQKVLAAKNELEKFREQVQNIE